MGQWQQWGPCSVTCGVGQHLRTRTFVVEAQNGGKPCSGHVAEIQGCEDMVCPSLDGEGPKSCEWGKWMEWGACDKCGGQRKRTRQIVHLPDPQGAPCIPGASEETTDCPRRCHEPIYCVWSNWEEEESCSVTCGIGSIKRVRYLKATHTAPIT